MSYPTFQSRQNQTQVLTVGKTPGNGETLDLGVDSLGLINLITASITNVNLDGGTAGAAPLPPGQDFSIEIKMISSFEGGNWNLNASTTSGQYVNPFLNVLTFSNDDPAPIYAQFWSARFLAFAYVWDFPTDIGVNASATVTLQLEYF